MYVSLKGLPARNRSTKQRRRAASGTVVLLGLTSLFTDTQPRWPPPAAIRGPSAQRMACTGHSTPPGWLAEGSLSRRELRTLAGGVECPSISPDGTKVVYKKRASSEPITWRLHVLDVADGRDVALAETRNVDDQAEWLDDRGTAVLPAP